jgi:hypothetical protein
MGQYWKVVNLDKLESIYPHKLGVGLKLGEQIGSGHGTPDALFILVATMRERRGGGDFDWDSNYYGPERDSKNRDHNANGGPVIEEYNTVAKRTIGRWAGDRIAVVGDYSEDSDLPSFPDFAKLYSDDTTADITDDVVKVLEHELGGKFVGDGWRDFIRNRKES